MSEEKKTRKTKAERLAELEEKKKQLQAKITKLQAADKEKERKLDARRKIILGGIILKMIKEDEILKERLKKEIDNYKGKDKDTFSDFDPLK